MMLVLLLVFSCFIEVYHAQSQANYTEISELCTVKSFIRYYNKTCEPFEPMNLNYSSPSLRISERKYLEYFEMTENIIRKTEWTQQWNENCMKTSFRVPVVPTHFSYYISRGYSARRNEFPHMGAVGWKAKDPSVEWVFKCGSTLISEKFLLTAAHCSKLPLDSLFDVIQSEPEIVRLGDINLASKHRSYEDFKYFKDYVYNMPSFHDYKINLIVPHPKYASPKKYFDIALIELQQKVLLLTSSRNFPARLWPNDNFNELKNEPLITGWGYTEQGYLPEILQVGTIHVLESSVCELVTQYNRNWHGIENHQICAGVLAGGPETCQGDSGGPLQIEMPYKWNDRNYYWVVGVTSFGISCKRKERKDQYRLGIYTRVSSFIDWIEEVVWKPMK